ncbi:MAG: head GIN domain-containing protein [Bacteroidota bacterium]
MQLIKKAFLILTFATVLVSCKISGDFGDGIKGSSNVTTESRSVNEDFKKVEVSYGIKVIVEQSQDKSITVEADDNLQPHIITKVINGVLIVEADEAYNSTKTPTVTVKMPVINGLSTTSGSKITNNKLIVTDNINVKSSSGSEIEINVEADNITLETSSGSNIEARGKALKLETASSSGSEIDAGKLLANEVVSQTSSGSSTNVHPIVSLKAKASSGSSIDYNNEPKTISKEESSGGSISRL